MFVEVRLDLKKVLSCSKKRHDTEVDKSSIFLRFEGFYVAFCQDVRDLSNLHCKGPLPTLHQAHLLVYGRRHRSVRLTSTAAEV